MEEPFVEPAVDNPEAIKPEKDECEDIPAGDVSEDTSVSKGWVIGPFFQSLKSKMASFTEIVMTPVKLFRASSPPPTMEEALEANGAGDVDDLEKSDKCHSAAQVPTGQQSPTDSAETKSATNIAPKYSKRLLFDESICRTEQDSDCAISGKNETLPGVVPLVHSSLSDKPSGFAVLLHPSAEISAFHESNFNDYITAEDKKGKLSSEKPLHRQDAGNGYGLVDEAPNNAQSCGLVKQSLGTNRSPLKLALEAEQMACQQISETCSVSKFARAKRGPKPNCISRDTVRRKQMNVASDGDGTKGPRTPRKRGAVTHGVPDEDETVRAHDKRQVVSTRANTKGKSEQDRMGVLIKSSSESQNYTKCKRVKRLQTGAALCRFDAISDNNMDIIEHPARKRLSVVLVRPDIKELERETKRNANKRPIKRKSPNHTGLKDEMGSSLVSTSSRDGLDPTSRDFTSTLTRGANQPSKRLRNSLRSAGKGSVLAEARGNIKEREAKYGEGFESDPQLLRSTSQPPFLCSGHLNEEEKLATEKRLRSSASAAGENFLQIPEVSSCTPRPSIRHVTSRQRRAENQRRRCKVLLGRMCKTEEGSRSITMEDADLAATRIRSSEKSFSRRLLRSYSCPDILLHPDDSPWTSSPHSPHHRSHVSHHYHHHGPLSSHAQRAQRRARRHTVCSVEVEREIAPLCLRKEVYPSRRSTSYDSVTHHLSPAHAHSPCSALTALASCFLSSPLAFLSKRSDCRGPAAGASSSSRLPSPPSSSSCSTTWHAPGFALGPNSAAALDSSSR